MSMYNMICIIHHDILNEYDFLKIKNIFLSISHQKTILILLTCQVMVNKI